VSLLSQPVFMVSGATTWERRTGLPVMLNLHLLRLGLAF
jgi:hypothetical protein